MAVRSDAVRAKLQHLREAVARLRRHLAGDRAGFVADPDLQWTVERGVQVSAECVFDVGNHLLAGALNGHADAYRDVVPRLGAHGVLPPPLVQRLAGLAGLRNLLVHDYASIDAGRLYDDTRAGLDALEDFAAAVTRWLGDQDR